jgi:glutaminase
MHGDREEAVPTPESDRRGWHVDCFGKPTRMHAPIAPTAVASPIQRYLERLHARHAGVVTGEVATYIPELGKADPDWFAICLATTDGQVYEVGESRQTFTIQSISKPITYGLALEDQGYDAVLAKVGVEPSGDAFNSISLDPETGCPLNPMINAGAIATTSLVAGHSAADRLERLLTVFSHYAGRRLAIDESVYRSEKETGHRNRAIGHMLRNFDVLTDDPDGALDLYFRQCSILVDCRDLALIAATLANGGVHPKTGERAVDQKIVDSVLSVMTTCGMYDFAGEWVYAVGMPAKSGVAGGVLAVLPGQVGIGVFSPRLDARGNSVRGVAVCTDLSRDFDLHFLRVSRSARSTIRAEYDLGRMRSRRLRAEAERTVLDAAGARVRIYELQGDLSFAAVEALVRRIVDAGPEIAVIDLRRTARIEACAPALLASLVADLERFGKRLVVVAARDQGGLLRQLQELLTDGPQGTLKTFSDLDPALEWCETEVLGDAGVPLPTAVTLAEHDVCRGLDGTALRTLTSFVRSRRFETGDMIVRQGDPADEVFLLVSGTVSVTLDLPTGERRRLSTVAPGMVFGELTIVDRSPRTADVRADTAVECLVLTAAALDRMQAEYPEITIAILRNLLRNVHRTVARLSREVSALSG